MMETLPAGTILRGRYRIERTLGSGGFGHVYLGVDLKTKQQFAIKEYLVTGPHGQEQLKHEAHVLGQLHHPNLPAFQESFDERGRYYVVLSYIEGNDLTDYIRAVRLRNETVPLRQILTWMLTICDAVRSLHDQQQYVVHRDIKPDNIRIMPNGTAVLVDMGNAKATADGARTLLFIRHQGTPGYAPPEQYPGGKGTDVRSDVYALGGTLYFALTAHEPPSVSTRNQSLQQGQPDLPSLQELVAKNPPEESADANAGRQFRLGISRPAKPAQRHSRHLAQLGQIPPELLDRLNNIIKRAMAMRPEKRYQTVAEFSQDLQGVLTALPMQQPPKAAREVSPYSTQPDLPLLYDAIQEAKEQKEQTSSDTSAKPASQPPPAPSPNPSFSPAPYPTNCPRCNTELTPGAAFCPQCGYSLANMPKANPAPQAPRPPTESKTTGRNPSEKNKAPGYGISTDETMMIAPQKQISTRAPVAGIPMLPDARPRPLPIPNAWPDSQNGPRSPDIGRTNTTTPGPGPQNSPSTKGNVQTPSHVGSNSSAPTSGYHLSTTLIMIGIFIVLLIAFILILVLTVIHGAK
jgi:serine/threonine protein kinase